MYVSYCVVFICGDREVFVSKEEDLTNVESCVNFAEGTARAPVFQTEGDAIMRCERLKKHLKELKEGDDGGLYRFASLYVSSSVEINRRKKDEALMLGSLGDFIDVEIKGNDVILTRDNRVFDDEELDDEEYTPSVYASIVDGVLYILKDFCDGSGYEPRVIWMSNQFAITIKDPEDGKSSNSK